ncbi:MAG: transglycosylase SLT domain-containing protein [Rhodocyclaceae bacterium]|nr:transglycosylase SLT domain-containing protein [Rhodocyclaceae bacterium]
MKQVNHAHRRTDQSGGAFLNFSYGAVLAAGLLALATIGIDPGQPEPVLATVSPQATTLADASATPGLMTTVRKAVKQAVAPRHTPTQLASTSDEGDLSVEMARVRDWVASHYRVSSDGLEPALAAAEEAGRSRGFDPLLIVAIMAVESSFNPRAVSQVGAQGLMQVMPKYHQDKLGARRGKKNALFDPEFNVKVGTQVLHEGLSRYGSLPRALQYYNGSLGDRSLRYTRKVMALKKKLVAAASSPDSSPNG